MSVEPDDWSARDYRPPSWVWRPACPSAGWFRSLTARRALLASGFRLPEVERVPADAGVELLVSDDYDPGPDAPEPVTGSWEWVEAGYDVPPDLLDAAREHPGEWLPGDDLGGRLW